MSRRADALARLASTEWDLLVVGGGITGAGVAREAARQGWRVAPACVAVVMSCSMSFRHV